MSLAVRSGAARPPLRPLGTPERPRLPWTALAIAGAVLLGALYPVSAPVLGPFGLPAAVLGVVLLAISLNRPGVGVAVALLLTSLTPGVVGPRAWMPGTAWTVLLLALLVLRPATPDDAPPTDAAPTDAAATAAATDGAATDGAATDGAATRVPPLVLPVLVYGATVLVAFGVGSAGGVGLPLLRSTVTGILLFVVAGATLRSWPDVTTVLLGASGAAVAAGGFATIQHLLGLTTGIGFVTSTGALVERATAGFGHPNLLAGFLVVLAPLAAAGAVVDRRWRLLHFAGLVLALGGIYASFSRGALVAMLVLPFLLVRGRWLLVLAPVAVMATTVALPSVMTERFVLGGSEGAEVAGRLDIWSTAGAIWLERPLLGAGLGSFPEAYATARVSGKQFLPDTRFEPPPHAHNLELQLLAEQGAVGFGAFAAVMAAAVWGAVRLRRSPHRRHAVVGAALLASILGLLVHNVFDVTLVENAGVQAWGVLGLLSAVVALDRAEGRPDGP